MADPETKWPKLLISTPMYGGNNSSAYTESIIRTFCDLPHLGIGVQHAFLNTESLIPRARNVLADYFLYVTDCTHALLIDADERWNAGDIAYLVQLDEDIVAAPYPKKEICWEHVLEAARRNPNITPQELSECGSRFNFNIVRSGEERRKLTLNIPWEVLEAGTGFMLIKRRVFEVMRDKMPEIEFVPRKDENPYITDNRTMHAYFDTSIDRETRHYCSEDYTFCRRWTDLGGQLFICPWMQVNHIGSYEFPGKVETVLTKVGKLK